MIPILNNAWSEAEKVRLIAASAPTLWLDSNKLSSVTASDNAVGTWASRTGSISFTQATAGNKPKLTRGDNAENRALYSDDATNWTFTSATEVNNVITASAGTAAHKFRQNTGAVVAGQVYVFEVDLTYGNHQYVIIGEDNDAAVHLAVLDLQNGIVGTQTNCTATISTVSAGRYKATLTYTRTNTSSNQVNIAFGTASNNTTLLSWNAAGTETFTFNSASFRSALANPTYLPTTTAQQYRGVNGRPAIFFDGVDDVMTSTATLANVFVAGAKTAIVGVTSLVNAAGDTDIIRDSSTQFVLYKESAAGSSVWSLYNDDGGPDNLTGVAPTLNKHNILVGQHDTNLSLRVNGRPAVTTPSGNTATTTGTMAIGAQSTTQRQFAGPITSLLTYNKVLHSSTIDRLTRLLAKERGASLV